MVWIELQPVLEKLIKNLPQNWSVVKTKTDNLPTSLSGYSSLSLVRGEFKKALLGRIFNGLF